MFKKIALIAFVFILLLTACSGKSVGAPAKPADISSALNKVLGSSDEQSVFPSYHIDLVLDTPRANDDSTAVINQTINISADVAGKNVHIFQTDPGAAEAKEGFVIGDTDKEFKMVNGVPEETMGQIGLSWAMWPLQVVVPYAYATSLYTEKLGAEDLNGRSAISYALDSSKADPAVLAGMQAMVGEFMSAKGMVWIDKETGGMLKLILDYSSEITSSDGSTKIGVGNGQIELEISKIGEVTVTSPK